MSTYPKVTAENAPVINQCQEAFEVAEWWSNLDFNAIDHEVVDSTPTECIFMTPTFRRSGKSLTFYVVRRPESGYEDGVIIGANLLYWIEKYAVKDPGVKKLEDFHPLVDEVKDLGTHQAYDRFVLNAVSGLYLNAAQQRSLAGEMSIYRVLPEKPTWLSNLD